MARRKSENRERAFTLWLDGGGKRAPKGILKEIAAELGVGDTQVRKWKSQDNWEAREKGALPTDGKSNVTAKKRPGGQPGNKNAAGHGAPRGNKNNLKHGLYETVYFDTLDEDEWRMIEAMRLEEEEDLLKEQIKLLTVRERRLLRRIQEQEQAKGGLALDSVVKRSLKIEGNVVHGEGQKQTETTTRTISTFEVIQRLEAELTRVQGKKTRCIEALNKLRLEREKLNRDSVGNDLVDDWVSTFDDEEMEVDDDGE